jgi:ABC-type antimicrobial peptide transport system permease subunit
MPDFMRFSPTVVVPLAFCLVLLVALVALSKVPVSYNVRNLLVRWRITFLTAIAFTLVVSLLTVMLAFVNGMARLTEASGQPGNVMILSDGATDELFSNLAKNDTTNVERQAGVERAMLKDQDGVEREYPLCSKETYLVVNQPIIPAAAKSEGLHAQGRVKTISSDSGNFAIVSDDDKEWQFHLADSAKAGFSRVKIDDPISVDYEQKGADFLATEVRTSNRRRFVQVRGIEDHRVAGVVHHMELFPGGKWWGPAGVQDPPKEQSAKDALPLVQAVLGEGAARVLGSDKNKPMLEVGDTFELGPRKWIVTGVMKSAGSTFGSELWAKQSVVGPMFGKDQFTCLVARTKDKTAAETLAHFLSNDYSPRVRAETETEYYSKLSATNQQFSIAIYFVTIIMAIGGVFGVMNTMFAAISQRTKDIGVLRILGFARWQILVSFFLETLVIALAGGLLGCALGYVCDGWTATSIVSSGPGGGGKTVVLKLVVDANTLAIGILFTLIMGAVGGLIPSWTATRLRPLESLR